MKKRLEADLISIAHRVLKLKNKSEVDQLYLETRKLYEALTVLKFYGDNYEQVKEEISEDDLAEKLTDELDKNEISIETTAPIKVDKKSKKALEIPIVEEEIEAETEMLKEEVIEVEETISEIATDTEEPIIEEKEEILIESVVEETIEEVTNEETKVETKTEVLSELLEKLSENSKKEEVVNTDSLFKPDFELTFDSKLNDEPAEVKAEKPTQVIFDDFLGSNYAEPVFVKPEELEAEKKAKEVTTRLSEYTSKPSLNDKISRGLTIGLNDRVAFMKHLFEDNSEDYNRVLSQLITFDSLQEAKDFLDNFVKPDYNDWKGKEEYAERFMEIIEKKFS